MIRKMYTIIDGNLYMRKCSYKGYDLKSKKGDYSGGSYFRNKYEPPL